MNVEIGTVAAQLLFWAYLFSNFRYWFFAVRASENGICLTQQRLCDKKVKVTKNELFFVTLWIMLVSGTGYRIRFRYVKYNVEKCDYLEEYWYSTGKHGNEVDEKEST